MESLDQLSLDQLWACLKKTAIEKRRNYKTTLCEYLFHFVIILVLVGAYSLSVVNHYNREIYSAVEVSIPPFKTNDDALNSVSKLLGGPVIVPDFDQYLYLGKLFADMLGDDASDVTQSSAGQAYTNLLYDGGLHFAPNTAQVDSLIEYMNNTYTLFHTKEIFIHESERDGVDYILANHDVPTFGLIVLREISPHKVNYLIRQNYSTLPKTNTVISDSSVGLDKAYQRYLLSGFMTLQKSIDDWVFQYVNRTFSTVSPECSTSSRPEVVLTPYPTFAYDVNPFYQNVGFLLGLAMVMATMYPLSRLTKTVVEEKETRMSELMKIMGLRDRPHHLSWFFSALILFFWIAATCTLIASTTFLTKSDGGLLFAYFLLFCLTEINLAFLISVFFSNSKLAAIMAPVALFGGFLPKFIFTTTSTNESVLPKIVTCLSAPTAFAFGADLIANFEYIGVGVQRFNMHSEQFNFATILVMLCVDFCLYGLLALYLSYTLPREIGRTQHPLLCLHSGAFGKGLSTADLREYVNTAFESMPEFYGPAEEEQVGFEDAGNPIEAIPAEQRMEAKVRMKGLQKTYSDGNCAVKDASLTLLENQITYLLGHNGSGKSTLLSVLTGLIDATGGDALVYGHSLRYSMQSIRRMVGFCPQQNVLCWSLTVQEHLEFFGVLKGIASSALPGAITSMLTEIGLLEKRDSTAASLSGGMKRKLVLAIALLGDPKFVLLDEPTSGMDPYSRQSVCDFLQRKKAGRVIVLTTHNMEEAEKLADRIAVMSEGRICCSGTPVYLKSRFGVGYILTMSKLQAELSIADVAREIQTVVPDALVRSSVAGEVVFQLPLTSIASLPALFNLLRERATALNIGSYGVSPTTLEQVFISIALESHSAKSSCKVYFQQRPSRMALILQYCERLVDLCCFRFQHQRQLDYAAVDMNAAVPSAVEKSQELVQVARGCAGEKDEEMSVPPNTPNESKEEGGDDFKDEELLPPPPLMRPLTLQLISIRSEEDEDAEHIGKYHLVRNGETTPSVVQSRTMPAPIDYRLDELYNRFYLAKLSIQFYELLMKRYVIMRRDLKGLFFQIVFPGIQIFIVLLILHFVIFPAGQTLFMNAELYPKEVGITSAVPVASDQSLFASALSSDFMHLQPSNATDSTELSFELLDDYEARRYGAYVFNDTIAVNVTVDWDWVQDNLDTLVQHPQTISAFSLFSRGSSNEVTSSETSPQDSSPAFQYQVSQIRNLFGGMPEAFNVTQLDAYEGSELLTVVSVYSLSYDEETQSFQLMNVKVTVGNDSVTYATVEVPLNATVLRALLPSERESRYTMRVHSNHTVMHNTSSWHAIAAFTGELTGTAFRTCFGDESAQYITKNHPLPLTSGKTIEVEVLIATLLAVFVLIPLGYVPSSFVSFIVAERMSKSKQLQTISGVPVFLYWLAAYVWDLSLYLVVAAIIMAAFYAFEADVFTSTTQAASAVFLLLFLYGASSIPLSFAMSLLFDNGSTAQTTIMAVHFVTGFVAVLTNYLMGQIPGMEVIAARLENLFRFFPTYLVGEGLINVATTYFQDRVFHVPADYFQWSVTGRDNSYMFLEACGYFAVILVAESPLLRDFAEMIERQRAVYFWPQTLTPATDPDVQLENDTAEAVVSGTNPKGLSLAAEYALVVEKLTKTFPPSFSGGSAKHAVRGLSLACPVGERFGLLGVNGAGKTTLLSILSGDLHATTGSILIGGQALADETLSIIGYCPQVDPLLDLMTGYETLWFFGRLRGIGSDALAKRVTRLVYQVGLEDCVHRPCGTYSGGNKRKLSLAISLIGNPKVLLLDEPSTGMDPQGRRQMWSAIEEASKERSVVLVSHSMEEVEALCTRTGVMVAGRFQCIGTVQHLKGRFGSQYQIDVRCHSSCTEACLVFFTGLLPEAVVREQHAGFFRLNVEKSIDLGHVFAAFEQHKQEFQITDYSISQCTLEQIFIECAKSIEKPSKN